MTKGCMTSVLLGTKSDVELFYFLVNGSIEVDCQDLRREIIHTIGVKSCRCQGGASFISCRNLRTCTVSLDKFNWRAACMMKDG